MGSKSEMKKLRGTIYEFIRIRSMPQQFFDRFDEGGAA